VIEEESTQEIVAREKFNAGAAQECEFHRVTHSSHDAAVFFSARIRHVQGS
jgi:hypothetical protein